MKVYHSFKVHLRAASELLTNFSYLLRLSWELMPTLHNLCQKTFLATWIKIYSWILLDYFLDIPATLSFTFSNLRLLRLRLSFRKGTQHLQLTLQRKDNRWNYDSCSLWEKRYLVQDYYFFVHDFLMMDRFWGNR